MSKISLNFFGETILVDKPKSLSSLRKEISELFCFSSEDAAEIILTYKNKDEKKTIENDTDLKTFLNSNLSRIDLDISQSSQLYKQNLNKLKEENLKDKNSLEELIKKRKELNNLKETKFTSEKKELEDIEKKIFELFKRKNEIRKKIFEDMRQIEKEVKENEDKIKGLQTKLGIKEKKIQEKNINTQQNGKLRFAPPILHHPFTKNVPHVHPCFFPRKYHVQPNKNQLKTTPNKVPHVHPCFFPRKYHIQPNKVQLKTNPHKSPHVHPCFFERKYHIQPTKKKQEVKLAEKEIIDIPKETSKTITITESSESNDDLNLKMRTIDDWGECLLLKTKEITDKLAEKFKGLETLKILANINTENKKEEIKTENKKEPSPIKPQLLKSSHGKRPEGVPKKMENYQNHIKTVEKVGNFKVNEKVSDKIMHFGVKCYQCKKFPIVGCRYKCAVCSDFDFCEDCEKKFSKTHNHAFFKINNPSMRELIFKNFQKK